MKRLEINPNNEKYYSKEFIQGWERGVQNQFDADAKVLEQIRAEIEEQKNERCFDDDDMYVYRTGLDDALEVIDKYR